MSNPINELHSKRHSLRLQGCVRDMIPVQMAIIAEAEKTGRIRDLAAAWNYLSSLHHRTCEYDKAEHAARMAMEIYAAESKPIPEVLGCFQFKLAQILAAQRRFAEAIPMAEAGILSYSVFHTPPDDFLEARRNEVNLMRELMTRTADGIK